MIKQIQLHIVILVTLQIISYVPLIAENNSSDNKDVPVYLTPNIVANNTLGEDSFDGIDLRSMPKLISQQYSNIPVRYRAVNSPSSITFYSDRTTFLSDHNNLFIEDFENTLVPDFGLFALPGPWDSSTNNACFASGGIREGIRFGATPVGELVAVGDGTFTPTASIGPNFFIDNFDIFLLFDIYTIGFDIYLPFGSSTYDIYLYGIGDVLIDVDSITPPASGGFWGVTINQPITRIRLDDRGAANGELIDNVIFGPTFNYVKVSGNVTWGSTPDPITGINVSFSNGGPSVKTDSNGYYEAFMVRPYSGTVTPSSGNIDFTPENIEYINVVSKQENQNFIGQPNIVEVSGTLLDAINNPIPDVTLTFDDGLGKILAKTSATITTFTDADGKFRTYLPLYWSGTVTPSKTDIVFDPSSYDFSTSDTKQSGLIFTTNVSTLGVTNYLGSEPTNFTILPAYPNPFNPSTTITYGLDKDSQVSIAIYDVSGKLIITLLNTKQPQGWHNIEWNGNDHNNNQVPAGIYLSKITSNNITKTSKLMLLK